MIFILDNLDSFTFNIFQQVRRLGYEAVVKRASQTSLADVERLAPDRIIISPGPGRPRDHPFLFDVLEHFKSRVPILGVCLGMQGINEWRGGTTKRAPRPVHGKTSAILHRGAGIFAGLASPFLAARYHSLVIDRLAADLVLTAWTDDGVPMGIEDRSSLIAGVQFHPESFMTAAGDQLLRNFLQQ